MKISIVTVCYNGDKTIDRTFISILNQSYRPLEYIIVDGESTDSTRDIINKYIPLFEEQDIEVKYVSEKDNGMYDAMNKGVAMASGDVIGILNSDDWYEENALNIVAEYVDKFQSDIYMGAINVWNGNQLIVKHSKDRKYKTSRNFNHPAMFVTKKCYEQVGKYGIENVHDDYGWYLKACKMNKKITIINEVLTNYPTGGAGSKKSFKNTLKRIGTKYKVYKDNGYSCLYYFECAIQEIAKYILLR